jgi:hypothetical protein
MSHILILSHTSIAFVELEATSSPEKHYKELEYNLLILLENIPAK